VFWSREYRQQTAGKEWEGMVAELRTLKKRVWTGLVVSHETWKGGGHCSARAANTKEYADQKDNYYKEVTSTGGTQRVVK